MNTIKKSSILILLVFVFLFNSAVSQNVVINEVMSSNFTAIQDEDGDFEDWFELYNTGSEPVNLNGYGLSDNKSNLFKWIFPDIILQPKEFLLIFASGKDRKELFYWENVIMQGDIWKYKPDAALVTNDWINSNYDDSSWATGPSGFGFGDNDDATDIVKANSIFIRKIFEIVDAASVNQIVLHMDYDDAFVAYLNGVEIARANIGTVGDRPAFNAVSKSSHEAVLYSGGTPEKFQIENIADLLKNGTNVLAIQAHNSGSGSTDFSAIPFLTIGFNSPVAGSSELPSWFNIPSAYLHTNFSIKAAGEFLSLCSPSGQILDSLHTVSMAANQSYGRFPDGSENWMLMSNSTPNSANNNTFHTAICENPVFSVDVGFYTSAVILSLSVKNPTGIIFYTLDGKEPTEQSTRYTKTITIANTTTVRARCFSPGFEPGKIVTNTYLINENTAMPVVSVTTEPYNLYDSKYGIFVLTDPYYESNLFQDWERPINIQFFEPGGALGFNMDAGVKVHGGLTRHNAQKSLALKARNAYGADNFNYRIFPDKDHSGYNSFILRNSGNDWRMTMFREGLMLNIIKNVLDMEISAYRPAIAFLNGGYYGIVNMQEKINSDFIADNTNISAEKIDLLEFIHHNNTVQVIEGTDAGYKSLIDYIATHDMADSSNYQFVADKVDINNLMAYQISQIYFDNGDWPGNNIKWWRPNNPVGKWRWLIFDTDFGFGLSPFGNETGDQLLHYKHNTLDMATAENGPEWPNPPHSTFLFRNLLKNKKFKNQFITMFCDHLNTTFQAQRIIPVIDSFKAMYEPEIGRFRLKYPECAKNWVRDIDVMKTFANNRVSNQFNHIMTQFKLTRTKKITLNVDDAIAGNIQVNTVVINSFPWNGSYFSGIPVTISAMPKPGYKFAQWSDGDKSPEKTVNLDTDQQFTAHFELSVTNPYSVIINEINYISDSAMNTQDWIEFYNNSEVTIDLSNWIFTDGDSDNQFVFPANTSIQPNGYLVLCVDKMRMRQYYTYIKNLVGDIDFKFSSSGETLYLYDSNKELIDMVSYGTVSPWPNLAGNKQNTIEFIKPSLNNTIAENWKVSLTAGGSPGAVNSTSEVTSIIARPFVATTLKQNYPNPFSTRTTINYEVNEYSPILIRIFDLNGRVVKTLVNENQDQGKYSFVWNGENDAGDEVTGNIYFCRMISAGKSETIKLIKQ